MKTRVHGNQVNCELEGPSSAPVVMLSHALGTDLSMWDPQISELSRRYRLLRYDTLGHGGSDAPDGAYTLDQLADQAAGLIAELGIATVHFLGLSMGGMIGQALALAHPEKVASLMLCGTSSRVPPEAHPLWEERIRIVGTEGMEPLVEPTITRWFTAPFRAAHPETIEKVRTMIRRTPPRGYAGCCHAVSALNLTEKLPLIRIPALVLVGEEDPGTPVAAARVIHERISGSQLVTIPSASHLSNMEQAEIFTRTAASFFGRVAF